MLDSIQVGSGQGWPGPGGLARTPQTGTVPRIRGLPFRSRDPDPGNPEFPDPAPNKSESILVTFEEPEEPGKVTFSGLSWDPEHTVIREIAESGSGRILALFRHLVACGQKPAFPGFLTELIRMVG